MRPRRPQAMEQLDAMIGLREVKDEIRQLVDRLQVERERAQHGHRATVPALHCVFLGNCVIRRKPAGDSDPSQPVIPTEASH